MAKRATGDNRKSFMQRYHLPMTYIRSPIGLVPYLCFFHPDKKRKKNGRVDRRTRDCPNRQLIRSRSLRRQIRRINWSIKTGERPHSRCISLSVGLFLLVKFSEATRIGWLKLLLGKSVDCLLRHQF